MGENGSGKSTFINTLLGVIKPIYGKVHLKSQFHNKMPEIGYCPQYNVLMDTLTVEENLTFYSAIKTGLSYKKCSFEIDKYKCNKLV